MLEVDEQSVEACIAGDMHDLGACDYLDTKGLGFGCERLLASIAREVKRNLPCRLCSARTKASAHFCRETLLVYTWCPIDDRKQYAVPQI